MAIFETQKWVRSVQSNLQNELHQKSRNEVNQLLHSVPIPGSPKLANHSRFFNWLGFSGQIFSSPKKQPGHKAVYSPKDNPATARKSSATLGFSCV